MNPLWLSHLCTELKRLGLQTRSLISALENRPSTLKSNVAPRTRGFPSFLLVKMATLLRLRSQFGGELSDFTIFSQYQLHSGIFTYWHTDRFEQNADSAPPSLRLSIVKHRNSPPTLPLLAPSHNAEVQPPLLCFNHTRRATV